MHARTLIFALLTLPAIAAPAQTRIVPVKPAAPPAQPSYANEPYVVEHEAQTFRYETDGTGERTLSATVHVQSDAAARQWGMLGFSYAAAEETVEVRYVRVQKPDGTVITTDPKSAQDQPLEVTRVAPLYSDQRQMQLPVKGLSVGDRVSYEVVVHVHTAEAPGQFWNALYFERTAVALDEHYTLDTPESMHVKVLSPNTRAVEKKQDGRHTYTWTVTQLTPSVSDAEKPDASDTPTIPDVAWTTFPSWAAVGAWWKQLVIERAVPDATIKEKAAALVAGATTPDEKLDRIYKFVSMQIRYIGVDFGVGRYQPHQAAEVLSNGYGDCKDKHTLLAAMLAAEGIEADPVLIGAGVHFDKDLTAPNNFNHMITRARLPGGRTIWLDSTEEVAPPGMLISSLRDQDALLMPAHGDAVVLKTPSAPPFAPADTYTATATLQDDGKLKGRFTVSMHGDLELICRMALFGGGPGLWPQIGQGISNGMSFGGTVTAFRPAQVEEPSQPLTMTYDYERDNFSDWPNRRILPLIPFGLFTLGDTLKSEPKEAIRLGAVRTETATSSITLPQGYSAPELPSDAHVKSSFATFDMTYSRHSSELVTTARMSILKTTADAGSWKEYNQFLNDVNDTQQYTQLSTAGDAAAAKAAQPASAMQDAFSQASLQSIAEALRHGDVDNAQKQLDVLRLTDPAGRGVAFTAATIEATKKQWAAAEADLQTELQRFPDEAAQVLTLRLALEASQKQPDKEIATLEALRAADSQNLRYPRMEAQLLSQQKRGEEAISLLEGTALRHPGDRPTMIQLGEAQMLADRPSEAKVTLETALDGSDDPETLNNAAYALANHNLDMPLALSSTHKALDLLDASTRQADPAHVQAVDLGRQQLLAATWDTLGWIDYQNGDMRGAEDYLLASWMTMESADNGYHLGMVYEKESKLQQAIQIYAMAAATAQMPYSGTAPPELALRSSALGAQGFKAAPAGPEDLARVRTVDMPLHGDTSGSADFFLLDGPDGVTAVEFVQGDDALKTEGPAIIAALNHAHLPARPKDSKAILLRRGSLSCSPSMHACQFLLHRPQETHPPEPPLRIVVKK